MGFDGRDNDKCASSFEDEYIVDSGRAVEFAGERVWNDNNKRVWRERYEYGI